MPTRYRYFTLWYQESLGDSSSVPFGVIVETKRHIYYLGFQLKGDASTVTGQVLLHFPEMLKERILAAEKNHPSRSTLEILSREFSWNVHAGKLSRRFSWRNDVEILGRKLFKARVEKWSPGKGAAPRSARVMKETDGFLLPISAPALA
jgi:hypothetical protein